MCWGSGTLKAYNTTRVAWVVAVLIRLLYEKNPWKTDMSLFMNLEGGTLDTKHSEQPEAWPLVT